MFKRLIVADWMNDISVISFTIFFVIFVMIAVWALCLPHSRIRHLESLPLEPEDNHEGN